MKKKEKTTTPNVLYVCPKRQELLRKDINESLLSLERYHYLMVQIALDGDEELEEVRQIITEITQSASSVQEAIKIKTTDTGNYENYAEMLQTVLNNDDILTDMYKKHSNSPITSASLVEANFKFDMLLLPMPYQNSYYNFTGKYCWTFNDDSQQMLTIKRRDEIWSNLRFKRAK